MATLTSTLVVRLLDQVSGPAGKAAKSLLGLGNAADRAGRPLGLSERMQRSLESNNRALAQTRGRLLDAAAGAYALKNTLGTAIGTAVGFESAMADVAKVSGFDDTGLAVYGRQLRKLATTEIPLAVTELAALSAAAAQAGIADEDLLEFTRMTAKTAVAWEVSGAAAGEALAKIKTQLNMTTAQTGVFADAINHLSDNTASSAPDLIDYSRRVAAQGEFFGFAATETLAFGAAMVSTGAQSEVAATSFRNMGRALTKGGSATKRMQGAYRKLGLDATKVAKAMQKDAMGTTIAVMERLAQLPDYMRASVMSDLFGDEARALAPLLNNLDILRQTLGHVSDETKYAGSVADEFARRARTTEYAWQRFKSQISEIGLAIGDALLPPLKEAMNVLGPIATRIGELADRFPHLTRVVTISVAGLIGLRIALIGVQWAALMARGGLLSAALPIVKLGTWAKNAAGGAVALQAALAGMSGAKMTGLQKVATAFGGIARAVPGFGILKGALTAIGGVITGISAPVAVVIGTLVAGGVAIYKYWDRISSILSGVGRAIGEELAPYLEKARPVLDWLAPIGETISAGWQKAKDALSGFMDWLGSFFSREVLSEDAKAGFETAGYDAAKRMIEAIKSVLGGLVSWASDLGGRVGRAISSRVSGAVDWVKGKVGLGGPDGARASGGRVTRGRTYLVGERGPELWQAPSSGRIVPAHRTMEVLRGGASGGGGNGAGPTVHATIHVNGVSDPIAAAKAVVRELEQRTQMALRGLHADVGVAT